MEFNIISHSEGETIELAENFESEKFENMVICLNGELGCGKTVFTKGFATALGISETVTSPTFTIIKEYEGELPLFHMDVYRLDEDSDDIGIEEYFYKKGVCIIEWSDNIKNILPDERLEITIKVVDENKRAIHIKAIGTKYVELCEAVL